MGPGTVTVAKITPSKMSKTGVLFSVPPKVVCTCPRRGPAYPPLPGCAVSFLSPSRVSVVRDKGVPTKSVSVITRAPPLSRYGPRFGSVGRLGS